MALEGGEGSASCPDRSLPLGKTRYPLWVGPRDSLDKCGKSRHSPGFNPWNIQPVASWCTDWAIWPAELYEAHSLFFGENGVIRNAKDGGTRPSPGFNPWTIQPVASWYTYWAIWPAESYEAHILFCRENGVICIMQKMVAHIVVSVS
jgi:hypothetical protein